MATTEQEYSANAVIQELTFSATLSGKVGAISAEIEAWEQVAKAKEYAERAEAASTGIVDYANAAKQSEENAKASEENAESYKDAVVENATNAKTSETNAKTSETNAKTSETNAKQSELNAKESELNAKQSELNAKESELNAAQYTETVAADKEIVEELTAQTTEDKNAADVSAQNAERYYELTKRVEERVGEVYDEIVGEESELNTKIQGKQEKLVSGENIKTINGNSILGEGNLTISGTGGGNVDDVKVNGTSVLDENKVANVSVPTKISDLTDDSVDGELDDVDISEIKSDLSNKQNSSDDSLETSDKTVVGAINELNTAIAGVDTSLTALEGVI